MSPSPRTPHPKPIGGLCPPNPPEFSALTAYARGGTPWDPTPRKRTFLLAVKCGHFYWRITAARHAS
jgi:hypothetical protein